MTGPGLFDRWMTWWVRLFSRPRKARHRAP